MYLMLRGDEMSYNAKVYMKQGGDALVVSSGGSIENETDGQALAISDITVTGTYADDDENIETAVNSILAALRKVGIIASA
jgi:hypothetical protein